MSSYDLFIKNGLCAVTLPDQSVRLEKTSIGVKNGKILALGLAGNVDAKQTIDATGLCVLPGAIDSQVHFREPGLTHKEDLYTGTLGAICGGITSIFEMPNTKPNTSTQEKIDEKIKLGESKAKCDFAFFVGATSENAGELDSIARTPGCCGIKIFMGSSTGDLLVADDVSLEKIFRGSRRPIAVHCEDEAILNSRKWIAEKGRHPRYHPVWRNVESALNATKRIVRIAEKYKRRVHILHVSSAEEMDFLRTRKHIASVECLPQFLTLAGPEAYNTLGTFAQMNPPIRGQRHQDALWKAIQDGTVDVLGSDHAPHTYAEKSLPYPQSPSGLTGVQTLLPLMLNHVSAGRLSLEHLVKLISQNPAKIYGARSKGGIEIGKDADFSVVDMKAKRMIHHGWIKSRCAWTPYDGMTVTGWPIMTILRGQIAMRDDTVFSNVIGRKISFNT
jgi:dihydroorotase